MERGMRVALIHDWLTGMRGGEKVLEVFCELFPDADLYTLIHAKGACSETIERMRIHTSFLQMVPFAASRYRYLLPVFPHAIESFALRDYDLVLSSSHCVAKGVIPPAGALHVAYVHTPMRYVWDQFEDYFGPGRATPLVRVAAKAVAPWLRAWDVATSDRADFFVANSRNVARRVEKRYRREAQVIHPPVDCQRFTAPRDSTPSDFYLMVTAFAPYKRVDLAVEAFGRLGRPLRIVGGGQDERKLKSQLPANVKFLGPRSGSELVEMYARCRALVFPGEEDFGIVPLEAQACGRPVIAFGKGGATETVRPLGGSGAPTGVFFGEQTAESLVEAVLRYEAHIAEFSSEVARQNAMQFDRPLFKDRVRSFLAKVTRGGMHTSAWKEDGRTPQALA
jgi:glycosyltransferase involved in cell wall biosynthesis